MKHTLLILLTLITFSTLSQDSDFEWVKTVRGNSYEKGLHIISDHLGNTYSVGTFPAKFDEIGNSYVYNFTSNSYNASSDREDIYIQKLNAIGDRLWIKQVGGSLQDYPNSVDVDADGNLLIAGFFKGTVDFDPGTGIETRTSNGGADAFILKLNADGSFNYVKQIGGTADDKIETIKIDYSGNIIVSGKFSATVDFDPSMGVQTITASGVGNKDVFFVKFDSNCNFSWVKIIKGDFSTSYGEVSNTMSLNNSGDIFLTGSVGQNNDFDPGIGMYQLTTNIFGGLFILKLTADGIFSWVKKINQSSASSSFFYSKCINVDNFGNVLLSGQFTGTFSFGDPNSIVNLTSLGYSDIFILKYDSDGNFNWVDHIGSAEYEYINSIDTDNFGNIFTTGYFKSTNTDFDPKSGATILTSKGGYDIFIQKLDPNGNLMWVKQMGGSDHEFAYSIDLDNFGNIYTTGDFTTENFMYPTPPLDFDPGAGVQIILNGNQDVYMHKLGHCQIQGTDVQSLCGPYTWIDGNTYTANNSTAVYTIENGSVSGCDSIVTLNLTINNISTGIDTQVACDSYTWIDGNTYTSNNSSAVHTIENGGINGCDSIVTLNLTINHSSTGIDTQVACDSYTWIDGNMYISNNSTAVHTIENGSVNGCDSIITLNLTIYNISGIDTQVACDSYTWIDGNTYTSNNSTAVYTIENGSVNGCDSIVTLNLTINNSSTGVDTQVACDSYTWIDGNTYTSNNSTAVYTIENGSINGCDSIVTLNLTINHSSTGIDTQTAIDSYTWIDGITYTSNNNSAMYTLVGGNAFNCDSIITLNLTFTNSIFEFNSNISTEVVPNPSTGKFFLKLKCDRVIVYDNLGAKVYDQECSQMDKQEIDLSTQLNGVYYCEIISEEKISIGKIVILK